MKEQTAHKALKDNFDGYNFDTKYFEGMSGDFDSGGGVRFKLINGGKIIYLHLYNVHNGYYSHGFEFRNANEIFQEGTI